MKNVDAKRYQDAQERTLKRSVNVAALVSVVAFYPELMRVDVQPLSMHRVNGKYQSQPPILAVPVVGTRGGGFIVRPWVREGDVGLVVYVDHDIDGIVLNGQESAPDTERNHATSDAVYIGGIVIENDPITGIEENAAVISTENGGVYMAITQDRIKMRGTLEIDGNVYAHGYINADSSIVASGNLTVSGNATLSGILMAGVDVKAGGISLSGHVHGGVETGAYTTAAPQ